MPAPAGFADRKYRGGRGRSSHTQLCRIRPLSSAGRLGAVIQVGSDRSLSHRRDWFGVACSTDGDMSIIFGTRIHSSWRGGQRPAVAEEAQAGRLRGRCIDRKGRTRERAHRGILMGEGLSPFDPRNGLM